MSRCSSHAQSSGCKYLLTATIPILANRQKTLSWIPVDQAARVAAELLLASELTNQVYHLENPTRQPWSDVCSVIENCLHLPVRRRLDYQEWLARIAARCDSVPDLLEFLQDHFLHMSSGRLILDMRNTLAISPALRSTGSVRIDTVELYLEFWKKKGHLN